MDQDDDTLRSMLAPGTIVYQTLVSVDEPPSRSNRCEGIVDTFV
jgi:hypothetical protein